MKHRNGGVRKICHCPRRQWSKCEHAWHFNYKPRFRSAYRFSLDAEIGKHIEGRTAALAAAEDIRTAIRAGTFKRRAEIARLVANEPDSRSNDVTFADFGEVFFDRAGKGTANNRACFAKLSAFTLPGPTGGGKLGEKPLRAITEDDVEAFFGHLRAEGRAGSTTNKYVQLVRAMFRWALKKGYVDRNVVAESEVIRRQKMAQRSRRLAPDVIDPKTGKLLQAGEERALLAVAGSHLQRLMIGALETGLRLGELLRLQWRDVDMDGRTLTVRAENTKTRTARTLPMSSRLHSVLEMARSALVAAVPESVEAEKRVDYVARAYVFGDAVGRRVAVVRKAWDTAVLKAHAHQPVWRASNTLAPASRAALRAIDLHFHDLRHEAGSRFIEAGWPLHHVQEMLGHKNLSQTSTYLNATHVGLRESMRRYDENSARCKIVASEPAIGLTPSCNGPSTDDAQPLVN
jgi:integrase